MRHKLSHSVGRRWRPLIASFALLVMLASAAPSLPTWTARADDDTTAFATVPGQNGKITFTSDRDGNAEIYVMDANGSNQTRLTNDSATDFDPAWSPDGSKIAFARRRTGSEQVIVINADGTGLTQLTTTGRNFKAAWSPDGSKIVFQSSRDGATEIYTMNPDGSSPTRLTNNTANDFYPAWSPNGSKISFTSDRDGNYEIYSMNADGSGQTRLTNSAGVDHASAWSPDSSRISFDSDRGGGGIDIWVMNADGSNQTRLTTNVMDGGDSCWSPDGTKIVFETSRDGAGYEIYVMNTDGSNQVRLTNNSILDALPDWQSVASAANPIDDPTFFVSQHYRDFLSREPDSAGLNFWVNEITSCGGDAACVNNKRTNVSQAFFLSIEFQQTGYFVCRLYKATFTDSVQRPRGLPRKTEFLADTATVGAGVIVGQAGWEQQLEQNRQQFALQWVQRAETVAAFPESMTAEQFVDKLFQTSEVTPSQGERTAALSAYGAGGTNGRAAALRSVADSGSVYNRQFNPAFVLMQYIGYLRRNPNDAPEATLDYAGYDFWLGKMNQFSLPGEDVRNEEVARARAQRAEMVRSFLVSGEYRGRFGQP